MKRNDKAIVIGAGVAGLATAIRLATAGIQVTVFEQNDYPGGKLSHFEIKGYQFDAGPSLFTQPELIEELFKLTGEKMEDYFSCRPLDISCNYFYGDGTHITAFKNIDAFEQELAQKLSEKKGALKQYLMRADKLYNRIGVFFLSHSLHKLKTYTRKGLLKAMGTLRWRHLFQTLHQFNTVQFTNPKTVQLFNRYATYNGSNPYQAPGMLSLIPHLEHNIGAYYPAGGMISITQALYQLAVKMGVVFHFSKQVERIVHHETKVAGVVVNGQNIYADIVISNLDVFFTYKHLLNNPIKSRKVLKQERSSSALIFYWGINRSFDMLGLHNIFFSENYQEEFNHIFKLKSFYKDPTVYINITSKMEPGIQAPPGKENWFVMVNVPAAEKQNWTEQISLYRSAIIEKLNKALGVSLNDCIEAESVLDPQMIEAKTGSYLGSLYGTSSNSKMAAFFRHANFSKNIKGLFFVGGSVHPGGGIPLCLKSAAIASDLILNYTQKRDKHTTAKAG